MRRILKKVLANWRASPEQGGRSRFSPRIEMLEDRCLLANFVWTGAGGNSSWFTAGNWDRNAVPGAADRATFDGTEGANRSNATIDNQAVTIEELVLDKNYRGTLTLNRSLTITGFFSHHSGTIAGGSSLNIGTASDSAKASILGAVTYRGGASADIRVAENSELLFDTNPDSIQGAPVRTVTG